MSIASDDWEAEPEIVEDVAQIDGLRAEDSDASSDDVANLDHVAVMANADSAAGDSLPAEPVKEEVADLDAPEAVEAESSTADVSGLRRLAEQTQDDEPPETPELRRLEPNVPEQYDLNLPPELIPCRPHDPEKLPSPEIEPRRIPEAPKSPAQPPEGYRGGGPEGGF